MISVIGFVIFYSGKVLTQSSKILIIYINVFVYFFNFYFDPIHTTKIKKLLPLIIFWRPSFYKVPGRHAVNDQQTQIWLDDLSNTSVPIQRLSKSVPHG